MATAGADYLDADSAESGYVIPGGLTPGDELASGDDFFEAGFELPVPPVVAVVAAGETPRWRAGPGSWYSRIWTLIGPRMPWTHYAMPFLSGPTVTLGSTATPRQIQSVKRQILQFKSPHAYPVKVILQFSPTIILGAGPWSDDGGHRLPLRTPFACTPHGGSGPGTPVAETHGPYCTWAIGRMMADNLGNMPFISGGYQV